MKILIINWRDPESPLEGGAERFTKKYAEFWVKKGHQVTWLTNSFVGGQVKIEKNGVTYLRIGPVLDGSLLKYLFFYPIYLIKTLFFAAKYIQKEKIDLVIDEIHGFPFFTPLYSGARNVLLVCEVAGPIWDKMFPFPINLIGRHLEKLIYQVYKNTEVWAISENTKKNIQDLLPDKKIKIFDLGIDENQEILAKVKNVKRTNYPSAVFLARVVKMKGIESAIESTADIVKHFPNFKLNIIGSGDPDYITCLQNKADQLKVSKNVIFLGKVSEFDKFKYLKQAHFLFHPSYKEGFGLTVLEAGLVGTPILARSGSSLDSLIIKGVNGYTFASDSQIPDKIKQVLKLSDRTKIKKIAQAHTWPKVLKDISHE